MFPANFGLVASRRKKRLKEEQKPMTGDNDPHLDQQLDMDAIKKLCAIIKDWIKVQVFRVCVYLSSH